MKTKLITALRTAAKALEDDVFAYSWTNPASCNCGILACSLMGKSATQMNDMLQQMTKLIDKKRQHTWKNILQDNCPVTGIPENEILRTLFGAGLTAKDIVELELLSNEKVNRRINFPVKETVKNERTFIERLVDAKPTYSYTGRHPYNSKENLIVYLRTWADLLQKEGAEDVVQSSDKQPVEAAD